MTISSVSAGGIIDPSWGNAVTDQLNDLPQLLQAGAFASAGGAGNGYRELITFPTAFASTPIVIVTTLTNDTALNYAKLVSVSATNFRCRTGDHLGYFNNAVTLHWMAFGAPV